MRLIFVHGIAQGGKLPADLSDTWRKTLIEGLLKNNARLPDDTHIDFPYYGDILDDFVRRSALPMPEDVVAKGPGQDRQFENFMQSALDEMRIGAGITDAEIEVGMEPNEFREKGVQNWEWVQGIVKAIDHRFTGVVDFSIKSFLKEVYVYLDWKAARTAVEKTIINLLTGEPTVVVGHSLGSVVAYGVLREHGANMNLRGFVTVGSPLGIKAISAKLGLLDQPSPRGWFNGYDERDIVALNPLDRSYFPVDPAIENFNGVRNKTKNRHGIIGYLDDPKVAARIHGFMI